MPRDEFEIWAVSPLAQGFVRCNNKVLLAYSMILFRRSRHTEVLSRASPGSSVVQLRVQPRKEFREIIRHEIRDVRRIRNRLVMRLTMVQASGFGCD